MTEPKTEEEHAQSEEMAGRPYADSRVVGCGLWAKLRKWQAGHTQALGEWACLGMLLTQVLLLQRMVMA